MKRISIGINREILIFWPSLYLGKTGFEFYAPTQIAIEAAKFSSHIRFVILGFGINFSEYK